MKKLISFFLVLCCTNISCTMTTFAEIPVQKQQKTVMVTQITREESFHNIQIIWSRGQVTISQSPDEKTYITEKAFVMPKETEKAGITIKNDTLFVKDYHSLSPLSLESSTNIKEFEKLLQEYRNTEYDLEIALPERQYQEFYFKTVNANCDLENNHFQNVTTETVNGNTTLNNITAESITSNTVNGNITLSSGTIAEQYSLNGINGNMYAIFTIFPTTLSVHNTNGNIVLTLPENDGFVIDKTKLKTYKDFSTSFYLKDNNYKKIYKNGKIEFDIVCTNGSVTLKRLD